MISSEQQPSRETIERLMKLTGLTEEEVFPIARNWDRTTPQSPEEVREGVEIERQRRMESAQGDWVSDLQEESD